MADIDVYLNAILSATYGEEVRSSIYNALRAMNTEVEQAVAAATGAQNSASTSAQAAAASASEAESTLVAAKQEIETAGQNMLNQMVVTLVAIRHTTAEYRDEAYGYKEDAETAAGQASQSATNAYNYANNASTQASDAARSARELSNTLTQCYMYARGAQNAANDAEDALIEIQTITADLVGFMLKLRDDHLIEDYIMDSDGDIVFDSGNGNLAGVVVFAVSDDVEYLLKRIETLKELIRRLEDEVTFLEINN